METEEGRFAHSIKLPNPLTADSGYRYGMNGVEYFEHLCRTEAGEFIYKTVEKVEGLMQLRPSVFMGDEEMDHLYFMEDPYGHTAVENPELIFVKSLRYRFLERKAIDESLTPVSRRKYEHPTRFEKPSSGQAIERFIESPPDPLVKGKDVRRKEFDAIQLSRFGYVWRGIRRPQDRELGIAGGELIVMDLATSEVLGVRRGFIQGRRIRPPAVTGNSFLIGAVCPTYAFPGRRGNKDIDFEYWFIRRVLKPINLTRPEPDLDVKGDN